MSNRFLTAAAVSALVLAAAAPVVASAQVLNMDMSWAIQSQMQNQAYAQAAAQAAAMNYLRYMQQLRAMGYTGPSLPTGVTPESLRQSINGMNEAWSSYNRAQSVNSQRLSNSVNNYVMQGIRGCSLVNYYGRPTYVCP
ncbi:MAG TPA: hypothetical protein PKJ45_05615 [Rubrivivax sp.]|nr:hypothetical protein [Burkholderiales bacterium]HNU10826.1 hypothetical protein [Rubrivivax sp.]